MNILTIAKIAFRGVYSASILLILSACASTRDPASYVQRFFHENPFRAANAIATKRQSQRLELISYGRAGGKAEFLVSHDDLIELWTLESRWGTLAITALPDEAPALQEGFADYKDGVDTLLSALDVAMQDAIDSLPAVANYGVDLKILLTFPGSGHAIRQQHLVDGTPLALAFLIQLIQDDNENSDSPENPATYRWADMSSTVAHELLHVEHRLQNLYLKSANEETAAQLFGYCTLARFAIEVGGELTIGFENMPLPVDWFPNLEGGVFAPRARRFPSKNATLRGEFMASAWLYHYASGEPLVFSDPEAMDRMLRLCDRLAVHVPDFVNGETGLESLE